MPMVTIWQDVGTEHLYLVKPKMSILRPEVYVIEVYNLLIQPKFEIIPISCSTSDLKTVTSFT